MKTFDEYLKSFDKTQAPSDRLFYLVANNFHHPAFKSNLFSNIYEGRFDDGSDVIDAIKKYLISSTRTYYFSDRERPENVKMLTSEIADFVNTIRNNGYNLVLRFNSLVISENSL